MSHSDSSFSHAPSWLGNAALLLFAGTLLGTGLLVILLLLGAADPKPLGSLTIDDPLDSATRWAVSPGRFSAEAEGGAYRITLRDQQTEAYITSPYQVKPPATLEVSVRQTDGPSSAGYGIWWGVGAAHQHRAFVVNGNSYVALFEVGDGAVHFVRPWELFPWVLPPGEINRLRIDILEGSVTLRLNEEVVGTFEGAAPSAMRVGFIVQTLNGGYSVVAFERLRIWQAASP